MYIKLIVLLYCVNISKTFLIYFSNKNDVYNDLNYYNLFLNLDNIITLKDGFTDEEFNSINYLDIKGFILPGGSSNFSDTTSNYWKYVNLVAKTNKPVIAICSGLEHYIKYLTNNKLKFTNCNIKATVINDKIHNHKWCVFKNTALKFNKLKEYEITYFVYEDQIYLDTIRNKRILGFSYHPEKAFISENEAILKSFLNDMKDIKETLSIS